MDGPSIQDSPAANAPIWVREPLEETLDGARLLTVEVVDRMVRGWWEQIARLSGVPQRRWSRHHPVGARGVVAMVQGGPAFDVAAWARLVSLVPGAVALPSRTAASHNVAREQLAPPAPRPWRPVDLLRARRRAARLRRAERTLDGDLAAYRAHLAQRLDEALAPGDDGTPFAQLPGYALAARVDALLATPPEWDATTVVEIANGDATARLLRLLADRPGTTTEQAVADLARYTTTGAGIQHGAQLEALAAAGDPTVDETERARRLERWLAGRGGWHALRDLPLEAPPLRLRPEVAARWAGDLAAAGDGGDHRAAATTPAPLPDGDPALGAAIERARRLTHLRESIARDRADVHAALRALTWTIGEQLAARGAVRAADDVFDLTLDELLRAARGVELPARGTAQHLAATTQPAPAPDATATVRPAAAGDELRGTPASAGTATGRVAVLEDPTELLDDEARDFVLVCRSTDPAWMPLLLRCRALVTERGGPLSHGAIVARELGVPAVVAVRDARALLRDEDGAPPHVRVDGANGVVTVLADDD